jgi:hypothetical protein
MSEPRMPDATPGKENLITPWNIPEGLPKAKNRLYVKQFIGGQGSPCLLPESTDITTDSGSEISVRNGTWVNRQIQSLFGGLVSKLIACKAYMTRNPAKIDAKTISK